jgi:hypothetical protein
MARRPMGKGVPAAAIGLKSWIARVDLRTLDVSCASRLTASHVQYRWVSIARSAGTAHVIDVRWHYAPSCNRTRAATLSVKRTTWIGMPRVIKRRLKT